MAERRSLEVVREYFDEGVSGAKSSRPALGEMLADAKRGKFRVLLVWKLDRLGRSLAHLVRLLEDLRACNVEFVSFSEGLDFTTTKGKLLDQVRAKGRPIGRPPRTQLSAEDRKAIAEAHWCRQDNFRELAKRFDTSVGTVQRCALA